MACGSAILWRNVLYFLNFITGLLGLGGIGVGVYALVSVSSVLLPWYLTTGLVVLGVLMVAMAVVGFCGAYRAEDRIEAEQKNGFLIIYFLVTFVLLVGVGAIAAFCFVQMGAVGQAEKGVTDELLTELENEIKSTLAVEKEQWMVIQRELECCGYGERNGTLATGDPCQAFSQTNFTAKVTFGKALLPGQRQAITKSMCDEFKSTEESKGIQLKSFASVTCGDEIVLSEILGNNVNYTFEANLTTNSWKPVEISTNFLKKWFATMQNNNEMAVEVGESSGDFATKFKLLESEAVESTNGRVETQKCKVSAVNSANFVCDPKTGGASARRLIGEDVGTCRNKLLTELSDNMLLVGAFGATMAFFLLLAVVGSFILACCRPTTSEFRGEHRMEMI